MDLIQVFKFKIFDIENWYDLYDDDDGIQALHHLCC